MRVAAIFPGQGAQSVGMLADVENRSSIIKQRFAEASEALSFDLWQMTQDGPAEALGQTGEHATGLIDGKRCVVGCAAKVSVRSPFRSMPWLATVWESIQSACLRGSD